MIVFVVTLLLGPHALGLDFEWSWFIFVCVLAFIGAVVEWRRGGKNVEDVRNELRDELREVRVEVDTLKTNKVGVNDWSTIEARCAYTERVADLLLEEHLAGNRALARAAMKAEQDEAEESEEDSDLVPPADITRELACCEDCNKNTFADLPKCQHCGAPFASDFLEEGETRASTSEKAVESASEASPKTPESGL